MASSFDLEIAYWNAWAPGMETKNLWSSWEKGERPIADQPSTIDLSEFPAMLRRRLSPTGKTAVHCLLKVHEAMPDLESDIPVVFCSHYGEVARSSKLLTSLAEGAPLSPTDFSLSVHNAVAGVYSIGCAQKGNITSISAGEGGLTMALLEARAMLFGSNSQRALCILYDAPLPEPYPRSMNKVGFPFALAMLLSEVASGEQSTGDSLRISLQAKHINLRSKEFPPTAFIRFLLNKHQTRLELTAGASTWLYERSDEQ